MDELCIGYMVVKCGVVIGFIYGYFVLDGSIFRMEN